MPKSFLVIYIIFLSLVGCDKENPDNKRIDVPEGRHIGWPIKAVGTVGDVTFELNEPERILKRFAEEGIKPQFVEGHGLKFLVWDEKDDEMVKKIIGNY